MDRAMEREKSGVREILPGITLDKIQPGGKQGPNKEVLRFNLGGQVWTDSWILGSPQDKFQLRIPDIRMPANQYYPLHWHGCWIAVIVLDGTVLIGDWWMKPGDVLVSAADLEYGPVVNGPEGCQLFEIFAQDHIALGGYASEYHDHPTLQGMPKAFFERTPENKRNIGNQVLPNAGVNGLFTGRFEGENQFDLGEPEDPERGIFKSTTMAKGHVRPAHTYADWHAILIMEGGLRVGSHALQKHDVLVIEPNRRVDAITAPDGAHLMEVARTAKGIAPIVA